MKMASSQVNLNELLVPGRCSLCSDGDAVIRTEGGILIYDNVGKAMMYVPETEAVLKYFHLLSPAVDETLASEAETGGACASTNSTSSAQASSVAQWFMVQERCLIESWKAHQNDFKNAKYKSADVWKIIANDLAKEGHIYTQKQVESKWKNLRKSYMAYVDTAGPNNSGGTAGKKPKLYDELDDIFRKTPHVAPVAVASSRRQPEALSAEIDTSSSSSSFNCERSLSPDIDDPKPPKRTKLQKELSHWTETMRIDAEKREEAREKRHNEVLSVQRSLVDVQKSAVDAFKQYVTHIVTSNPKT